MSAADMTRAQAFIDRHRLNERAVWVLCALAIVSTCVSVWARADRDDAIRQRDEARAQSAVTRDALDVINDIESYRQMIDDTGASFCFSMKGALTGCLWRKP